MYQRSKRTHAWSKSLGLAAAIAGAVFASGVVQVPSAQASTASRPPATAGAGNGIYTSPALNKVVPQTFDGTTINWVTGAFDDSGPITGNWDLNFWASGAGNATFDMTAVDDQGDEIVVDASGKFVVLQAGAVIGPSSTFLDGDQAASADWLAGADGYIGFKFNCDGRLTNPVAGGVCYGYARVTTTGPSGFPATIVEYAYDGDGNPITIPGGTTYTVTPSVGTPSGTISPDTAQTVSSGTTTSFTLTPASGFHLDNVGGTCGGTLAGNVYTTTAVSADCTVIANFAAGDPVPVIAVTPSPLAIAVDAGATETGTLTVANTGGGTLTYSISEAAAKATANRKATRTKHAVRSGVQLGQGKFARALPSSIVVGKRPVQPVVLGGLTISQMPDNTMGDSGIACGENGEEAPEQTFDNSWWRRFYFNEHPEVGASANVASVTIGAGQNGGSGGVVLDGLPVTINLFTIPHSTPVDTIDRAALTPIGTATGTISGGNVTVTIPVTGAIADTAGNDLVVEFHTDGNESGEGFLLPGANASPQTHPSFLSSDRCGLADPTSTDEMGFEDFHLVMVVTLGEGGGATCDNPSDVPWLSVAPASGSLAGGASADSTVTVDASSLAAGSYSANLCVTSNDPATPLVTVPVNVTVAPVAVDPCSAKDTIFCDGFDGAGGGPFEQPVKDPSFEATPGSTEPNPDWTGVDDNSSSGGTPFYDFNDTTLADGAHT
ncbi:hypothetical protein, partial [Dokdonella sp.]|uniref:hypothetical protein n=1 Tax=Dokdonella sp. TaxID=2291710 RepID=UPI0025B95872